MYSKPWHWMAHTGTQFKEMRHCMPAETGKWFTDMITCEHSSIIRLANIFYSITQ